ncbi:MAG: glycosyltransferase family 4 protein [Candidatus Parcubacteria bacterium]|nr:glycosyltransferase family 4 protein [Candidatus Parcubacteria bacterium]
MKILILNENIYGTVSGEKTLWSVLAKNLPNCEAIALNDFKEEDLESYIKNNSPDILVFNSILGDIKTPENVKKIVVLQDNFLAMKKVLPGKFRRIISKIIRLGNDFYSLNIKKQKSALLGADLVIAVSRDIADWYRVKTKIIPIGIDMNLFKLMNKESLRGKYNIPLHSFVKIYVGSTHLVKGWDILQKEIENDKDNFYILVFKDGKLPEISFKNVKIFNRVSQTTLAELYNCADIYIGRSRVESLWLTPIEAMFCNVPVDVSRVGIFKDWYPENKNPREEAFKKGLSREEMLLKWNKIIDSL